MLKTISQWENEIHSGALDGQLLRLYANRADGAPKRYSSALSAFISHFGGRQAGLFSAPGRTELAGNHTDHQNGCVLAASVNMDMIAVAAAREDTKVFIVSQGYGHDELDLASLEKKPEENGGSKALIRGVAAAMTAKGARLRGFDAYVSSEVPQGSGLSSSAAFEVLTGKIFSELFCGGRFGAGELAIIGQYAENEYFGKPSGLMDQMASAEGGVVFMDFADPAAPQVRKVDVSFEERGFCLCITDAGGGHASLTDEYADITREMGAVAGFFEEKYLRNVSESRFNESLPVLRKKTSDRAVLRAMHFFNENGRVLRQLEALEQGNMESYLELMSESGLSSMAMLQNIWPSGSKTERSLALALAVSGSALKRAGASRVHGGGFAGTIQALVPAALVCEYKKEMDRVFGKDACHILAVRPVGAYVME